MSILIGIAHNDGVTIGADSRLTADHDLLSDKHDKWISAPGLTVGFSGSLAARTVLRKVMKPRSPGPSDPYEFVDRLRWELNAINWEPTPSREGGPPCWSFHMLATDHTRLWEIDSTFHVLNVERDEPAAIGCAFQYALGAMHAVDRFAPVDRVYAGLKAAAHYDTSCGGRLVVETLDRIPMEEL